MLTTDKGRRPRIPRAWGRSLTLGLILSGFFLAAVPGRADLIIFKDGFMVHGRILQDKTNFVDPVSGQAFLVARLGGFYKVDDGARLIMFSPGQVADAVRQDFDRATDQIRLGRVTNAGFPQLAPTFKIVGADSFDKHLQRDVHLQMPSRRLTVTQRVVEFTPHHLRLEGLLYTWTAFYLTQEFDAETIEKLLQAYLNPKKPKNPKQPPSPSYAADNGFLVFRFLCQAGFYDAAEKKLKDLQSDFPQEKHRLEASKKVLTRLLAMRLADDIEIAARASQHTKVQRLLVKFFQKQVDAEQIGERKLNVILALQQQYRTNEARLKEADRFLRTVPGRIVQTGQRKVFRDAAQIIRTELNLDTLPRLEGFVALAAQAERATRRGKPPHQTPPQLMAVAVTGWLLGNDAAEGQVQTALNLWEAREVLIEYQKTKGTAARKQMRDRYRNRPSVALDEMAWMLRNLPPAEPEPIPRTMAKKLKTDVPNANHGAITYHVQLPPEYHHYRPYPVLIALHGVNETAPDVRKRWGELAAKYGYILAAPEWSDGSGKPYEFTAEEHAAVLDTLRDLRRRFQVDSDRVFLFGFEEGGNMAFDVGLSHPDLFAGVVPMAAKPRWFATKYWPNAQNLPFYVVGGAYDTLSPKYNRDQFKDWVRCHYPCLYIEYRGRGPEWFAGELPHIMDWMSLQKRANPWRSLGARQDYCTMRPTDNHFYWLSAEEISTAYCNDAGSGWKSRQPAARLSGSIGAGNSVWVTTHGIKGLTVWFGPGMLEFGKPVTIRVNGQVKWNKKLISPHVDVLLEDLYQRGDRQRVYLANWPVERSQ
jgi:predicted esterase